MLPNPGENEDLETNLDLADAGDDVDPNAIDDAERDELAAAEARGEKKTPEQIQQEMLAAMNEVELDADGNPVEKAPAAKLDKDGKPVVEPKVGADGKPIVEPGKEKPTPQAEPTPDDKAAAEKAEADARAAVNKEAATLGIKGKARERFHQLNADLRKASANLTQRDAQLDALVGKAAEGDTRNAVERIEASMKQNQEFQDAIFSTGLTAEDFQYAAGYKMALNSPDPAQWLNAEKFLLDELTALRQRMGAVLPNNADILSEHKDLLDKVEAGKLDREDAEENARLRNLQKAGSKARETATTQTAQEKAVETASAQCVDFASRAGQDTQQWASKWPTLKGKIDEIRKSFPPTEWADRIELAYGRIPYTPPAPVVQERPRARVGTIQPVRGGGGRPAGVPATNLKESHVEETPLQALQRGLREGAQSG